jgi:hypothetical protein
MPGYKRNANHELQPSWLPPGLELLKQTQSLPSQAFRS